MQMKFGRRALLKGGMATTASLLPMLRNARAFAQTGAIPKRILFVYTMTGNLATHPSKPMRARGNWEPLGPGGNGEPTETGWELNTTMAPLAAHKRDLILFENLDNAHAYTDPTPVDSGHHNGGTTNLTGINRLTKELPGGLSIDQFIARQINSPAALTRLPSLDVASGVNDGKDISEAFATGPGMVVPRLWEPQQVYARAFPDGPGAQAPNPGDTGAAAAAARLQAMRNREFEFLAGHGKMLHDRLAPNDRTKVQQHLDTLSDLRQRLSLTTTPRPSTPVGQIPPRSMVDPWTSTPHGWNDMYGPGAAKDHETKVWNLNVDLNSQLAVAALASDATRVASILIADPPAYAYGLDPGRFGATDAHDMQHKVNSITSPVYTNPEARAVVGKSHTMVMEKVKNILDMLASRTESDGSRMLDHTLVVFTSQISNGNHDVTCLPWFVAGNIGGYFKTGRYLRFGRQKQSWAPSWVDVGRAHNDLFVSLANAMGVGINTFGNARVCTGPITQMRG